SPAGSGHAATARTLLWKASVSITGLGALCERINEAGGDAIEDRTNHHFESPVRKGVFHGVEHFAGIGRQLLKTPGGGQRRERAVHELKSDHHGILMIVAGGEGLLDAGVVDGEWGLRARFFVVVDVGDDRRWTTLLE